jgi:hypothetical protein
VPLYHTVMNAVLAKPKYSKHGNTAVQPPTEAQMSDITVAFFSRHDIHCDSRHTTNIWQGGWWTSQRKPIHFVSQGAVMVCD